MENKNVSALHKNRRVFAIRNGVLNIGPEDFIGSHKDWFKAEGWLKDDPELIEHIVRGFVDETGINFYIGRDFRCPANPEKEAFAFVSEIADRLNLGHELAVFCGVNPGVVGEKWTPYQSYGKIQDYLK